ncbi:uncharacterized protein G2W53_007524 [Senna tora]|uniref:Uncharacterized protein n=1 Tax=Senna tora TaxID=362788 RepID=A0A835CHC6_9FABA|nr:uncharacterized protein G2W53_007524 [Senna tora]
MAKPATLGFASEFIEIGNGDVKESRAVVGAVKVLGMEGVEVHGFLGLRVGGAVLGRHREGEEGSEGFGEGWGLGEIQREEERRVAVWVERKGGGTVVFEFWRCVAGNSGLSKGGEGERKRFTVFGRGGMARFWRADLGKEKSGRVEEVVAQFGAERGGLRFGGAEKTERRGEGYGVAPPGSQPRTIGIAASHHLARLKSGVRCGCG